MFSVFLTTLLLLLSECFHLGYQKYSDFMKGAAEEQLIQV